MWELLLEHLFIRIEIVVEEIEKVIRFAACFPFGHSAWQVRFKNHPIRPFLIYFKVRQWPLTDTDNSIEMTSAQLDIRRQVQMPPPVKRQRSGVQAEDPGSFAMVSPAHLNDSTIEELDVFEDACL